MKFQNLRTDKCLNTILVIIKFFEFSHGKIVPTSNCKYNKDEEKGELLELPEECIDILVMFIADRNAIKKRLFFVNHFQFDELVFGQLLVIAR